MNRQKKAYKSKNTACWLTNQEGWTKMFSLPILSTAYDALTVAAIRAEVQFGVVIGTLNINPQCDDTFASTLSTGIVTVIRILMGLGVAIMVLGLLIGAIMRATAWENEQKIGQSYKALWGAGRGLV